MKSIQISTFLIIILFTHEMSISINLPKENKKSKKSNASSVLKLSNKKQSQSKPLDEVILPNKLKEKLKDLPVKFLKYFRYLNYQKIITTEPYLVKNCDEYILIPCSTIKDKSLMNVINKEDCFLNVNFHNIVVFRVSAPETLNDYLDLRYSKLPAKIVQGDPECVYLESKDGNKMNFCLDNHSEALQIIESIKFFEKCSKGDEEEEEREMCFEVLLKAENKLNLNKKHKKILDQFKRRNKTIFSK